MRRPCGVLIRPNSTVYQYRRVSCASASGPMPCAFTPPLAVSLHVVGEHRVHQQRHVAEQVMEQVRLGQVVELLGPADPPGHREAAVGQVLEEIQFRQQALHADQLPAGLGAAAARLSSANFGIASSPMPISSCEARNSSQARPTSISRWRRNSVRQTSWSVAVYAVPGLLDDRRWCRAARSPCRCSGVRRVAAGSWRGQLPGGSSLASADACARRAKPRLSA